MGERHVVVGGHRYVSAPGFTVWRCVVGTRSYAVGPRFSMLLDRIYELESAAGGA